MGVEITEMGVKVWNIRYVVKDLEVELVHKSRLEVCASEVCVCMQCGYAFYSVSISVGIRILVS